MSRLRGMLAGGLILAAAPAVAMAAPVRVSIDVRSAPRPDGKATTRRIQVDFASPEKAAAVCNSQTNTMRLATYTNSRHPQFYQYIFSADCVGYDNHPKPRPERPLSPQLQAAIRDANTAHRVILELHFLTPQGRPEVERSEATTFGTGSEKKFCASVQEFGAGLVKTMAYHDQHFATLRYVGANCAVDKNGQIQVSIQSPPAGVK